MNMKRDYYEILEISQEEKALPKEEFAKVLKSKYRKASKKYHPDVNKDEDAEIKFKEVNEANEVLSDPEKRRLYDQFGHDWENSNIGGFEGQYESFMNQFARRAAKGKSIKVFVDLTLEECYSGCEKEVKYTVKRICNSCNGNGSKNGSSYNTCTTCAGSGQEVHTVRKGAHVFQTATTCRSCNGQGIRVIEFCDVCNGAGIESVTEVANITFPRGVEDGQAISASGRGHYSQIAGAERGDAIFIIKELEHELFERNGLDLKYIHKINYEDLVLGSSVEVPTISGKKIKFNVEPETQNGKVIRVKSHGMPHINLPNNIFVGPENAHYFGNLIIELSIDVPTKHSEEEIEIFKQLRELRNKNLQKLK